MIKTIALSAGVESSASVGNSLHVCIRNNSTGNIYASTQSDIVVGGDNVMLIRAGESGLLRSVSAISGGSGSVWLLSAATASVELEGQDDTNFSKPSGYSRIVRLEGEVAGLLDSAKIYGVSFSGASPTGTRTDSAVGMTANVAVGSETVTNDFDAVSFYDRPICCCSWDSQAGRWIVNAYRGEPNFAWDGSNGELMYECTPFYYQTDLNTFVRVSAVHVPDFRLAPMFPNGADKVYLPVFWLAKQNGVATSRSGLFPESGSLISHMTSARTFSPNAHLETMKSLFSEYLLQLVEFATRDLQSVMMGACNLRSNNGGDIIQSVTSTTSFTVPQATAAALVAGQSISIGTAIGGEQRTDSVQISSIIGTTITLSSAVENVAAGDYISSRAWKNGSTNGVVASSGSPMSNTSGLYPCIWRGKVDPWAEGYSTLCDVLQKRTGAGTEASPYVYSLWYITSPNYFAEGEITEDYLLADIEPLGADGYVSQFSIDSESDYVFCPTSLGASSVTGAAAYYSYSRADISACRAGGTFAAGRTCSPVYFNYYTSPSNSAANYLARLCVG